MFLKALSTPRQQPQAPRQPLQAPRQPPPRHQDPSQNDQHLYSHLSSHFFCNKKWFFPSDDVSKPTSQ
jgi:hypothetical protein